MLTFRDQFDLRMPKSEKDGEDKLTSKLTDADNIELETTLQQFALNLSCDAVETNVASGEDSVLRHGVCSSHGD